MQLVTKGNDFAIVLMDVVSKIIAREAELKNVWAEKDAELERLKGSLAWKNEELERLKSLLVAKDVEIENAKAEKYQIARKFLNFKAQFAFVSARNQRLLHQVKAKEDAIKYLQSALSTATASSESILEHEKTAFERSLKEQKCDAFRFRFFEGSRPIQ